MSDPETKLWLAVIQAAIEDATRTHPTDRCPRSEIEAARAWLTIPNEDFDAVCELAGLNPESVREYALRVVDAPSISPDQAPRVGARPPTS